MRGSKIRPGIRNIGIKIPLPLGDRIEAELKRRRKQTGDPFTLSDLVREILDRELPDVDAARKSA